MHDIFRWIQSSIWLLVELLRDVDVAQHWLMRVGIDLQIAACVRPAHKEAAKRQYIHIYLYIQNQPLHRESWFVKWDEYIFCFDSSIFHILHKCVKKGTFMILNVCNAA